MHSKFEIQNTFGNCHFISLESRDRHGGSHRRVTRIRLTSLHVTLRHSRQCHVDMTRGVWHHNYVYYVRAPQPTDLDWDVIHFSRYTLAKIYVKDKNAIVSQTTVH